MRHFVGKFVEKWVKPHFSLSFPYKENWKILLNHKILGIRFIFIVKCLGSLLLSFSKEKKNNHPLHIYDLVCWPSKENV